MISPINSKNIEIKVRTIRPGVELYTFKNFEDMGNFFISRIEEFEMKKVKVVTVGSGMFIFQPKEG